MTLRLPVQADVWLRWSAEDAEVLAERLCREHAEDAVYELGPLPVALRLLEADADRPRAILEVRVGTLQGRVQVRTRGVVAELLQDLPWGTPFDPIELPEVFVLALMQRVLTAARP